MRQETLIQSHEQSKITNQIQYAKVAINLPVKLDINSDNSFYYSIPEELKNSVKPGTIVHVPFRKQETNAFVLDIVSSETIKKDFTIKPVYEVLYKEPIWNEGFLKLADWMSRYYLTNIGTILSSTISSELLDSYTHEAELIMEKSEIPPLSDEQLFIINKFLNNKNTTLSYRFLLQKSRFSKNRFYQLINQLKEKNIISTKVRHKQKKNKKENNIEAITVSTFKSSNKTHILNKEQEEAYIRILEAVKKNNGERFLLHGVTGSGKTEVYLRLIEEAIKLNKSVVYLVPEIYLIPQASERLASRFGKDNITLWHSSLSSKERLTSWENIHKSKTKIILGARSAILAPIKNLGLIVIDEAHDASYKQASPAPRYDAIKVALKRSEIDNCPIVLGTATPNITEYFSCQQSHTILELPNRIENVPMPKVYAVDLANEYPMIGKNTVSNVLKSSINEALSKNEQIILLLNRRGYSSHIFCRACGYIQFCKNCSVPLVFHKDSSLMVCHHCGYKASSLRECPDCKSPHFKYFGLGTQQLEEEVKKLFKTARVMRVDSDQLSTKDQYIKLWEDFSSHKADILIGTQIIAKGLDLPNVTVVGVILADTMFNFPDYVSHERAFQLLTQVTGRTGRGQKPGQVFIQTYQINNPVFKYIQEHDFNSFYTNELNDRKMFSYPPFTTLSRIILQSFSENDCIEHANEVLNQLREISKDLGITTESNNQDCFLGPAPCFFSRLKGKYRHHILCKINSEERTNVIFNKWLQVQSKNAKVEVIIDIDSVNLL